MVFPSFSSRLGGAACLAGPADGDTCAAGEKEMAVRVGRMFDSR